MTVTENDLDQLASHTLRIELLSGMVLIYSISISEKQNLIGRFRNNSDGTEEDVRPFKFLWFETSLKRQVVINITEIARVTFLYDYNTQLEATGEYFDNFKVLEKDTTLIEEANAYGKVSLHVATEEFLPMAILYHKGLAPKDEYNSNPLLYNELSIGCLGLFALELEDEIPLRQFINLLDADGEENFIPLNQIIVFEFDETLFFDTERDNDENEEEEEAGENGITPREFDYDLMSSFNFNKETDDDDLDQPADESDDDFDKLPF